MDEPRSEPSPKPAAGASRRPTPRPRGGAAAPARGRAAALVALVALIAGLIAGGASAGGHSHRQATASTEVGFLGKIKRLAGDGAHSFAVEQRADENAAINRTLVVHAGRADGGHPAPRAGADVRRRPRAVHAAAAARAAPHAHAGDLLRGRRRGAVLPRRHLGDRQARLSDRRSHLEPSRHGRAVTRPAAGRAAAGGARRSDATARRSRGCSARPTATVERDHAAAAAASTRC